MQNKVEAMKQTGLSHEAVVKIVKGFPAVLGASLENIITKLIYYFEIGIIEYIVEHPKELMQSTDLTRACFAFFFEHGIAVYADKIKRLFYGNKQFEEIYKITKEEILSLYLPVQITKAGEACKH